MSYMVSFKEGKYPEETGSYHDLIGIYSTENAANFIADKARKRHRINAPILIEQTDLSPTSMLVEDYLNNNY